MSRGLLWYSEVTRGYLRIRFSALYHNLLFVWVWRERLSIRGRTFYNTKRFPLLVYLSSNTLHTIRRHHGVEVEAWHSMCNKVSALLDSPFDTYLLGFIVVLAIP